MNIAIDAFLSGLGAALLAAAAFVIIMWALGTLKGAAHNDIEL